MVETREKCPIHSASSLLGGFEDSYLDVRAGRAEEASTVRLQRAVYHRPILNYGAPLAWESYKSRADPEFIDWFERNVVAP